MVLYLQKVAPKCKEWISITIDANTKSTLQKSRLVKRIIAVSAVFSHFEKNLKINAKVAMVTVRYDATDILKMLCKRRERDRLRNCE